MSLHSPNQVSAKVICLGDLGLFHRCEKNTTGIISWLQQANKGLLNGHTFQLVKQGV